MTSRETKTFDRNFLPAQYEKDRKIPINHCYLREQFHDYPIIMEKIAQLVTAEDFTLGKYVDAFEESFRKLTQTEFAIGVGSGTDALFLSLKALGIGEGMEVITTPFTFFATIGAIVTAGARPVFVDIDPEDFNIDPRGIEAAITSRTRAILPVHWSGLPCHMKEINRIAQQAGLKVIEDSCHGIMAHDEGIPAGSLGDIGCFSMHPLKNLNVWGDGGVITTDDASIAEKLHLLRNHGLKNRDICEVFAYNSRLDSLQAIVGSHLMEKLPDITKARISNAQKLDSGLANISGITLPKRYANKRHVYHLYSILADKRDELQSYLVSKGIDAKIHYPIPMHLQPAAKSFGYRQGSFPKADFVASRTISLPVHEFVTDRQIQEMVEAIHNFYRESP